jgi:hypothetical protein
MAELPNVAGLTNRTPGDRFGVVVLISGTTFMEFLQCQIDLRYAKVHD